MRMWSCRSGFGPGAVVARRAPTPGGTGWPGRARAGRRTRRRRASSSSAQPTSGSARRVRNLRATCTVNPDRMSDPQQDRALERRPHRGDVEERGRAAAAVVVDELHGEVAGDQRPLHGDHGHHRAEQRRGARSSSPVSSSCGRLRRSPTASVSDAEERRRGAEDDAGRAEDGVHGAAVVGRCVADRLLGVVEAVVVLGLVLARSASRGSGRCRRQSPVGVPAALEHHRDARLEQLGRVAVVVHVDARRR